MNIEISIFNSFAASSSKLIFDICNAALILAKSNNTSSVQLAEILKKHLLSNFAEFKSIEIAGPGFLNIYFHISFWKEYLTKVVKLDSKFGCSKILRKKPWIIIKIASTLDGKIAVSTGNSKWITGEKARKLGHKLRAWCDAILIGKNTVLKDNPELTCRFVKGKNPIRIVFDTNLTLPLNLKIFEAIFL